MDNKKLLFLSFVVENITENPEWLPDLTQALNRGLSEALSKERTKVSNLAAGFGWMIQQHPGTEIRFASFLTDGLRTLSEYYTGTEFSKKIARFIKRCEEEE